MSALPQMLDDQLQVQLEVYRNIVKDPEVPIKARLEQKAERLEQVLLALGRYRMYVPIYTLCFLVRCELPSIDHVADTYHSRFPTSTSLLGTDLSGSTSSQLSDSDHEEGHEDDDDMQDCMDLDEEDDSLSRVTRGTCSRRQAHILLELPGAQYGIQKLCDFFFEALATT